MTRRYAIGIDLGTTNCVLAYVDPSTPGRGAQILPVPQWEELGSIRESETLPSFAYLSTEPERSGFAGSGAPSPQGGWIPGSFARGRMATHPGRVVHSAKSWLSHGGVDRTAPILPWQSEEVSPGERISPVQASAAYLSWLRRVWDAVVLPRDPGAPFDAQDIVVTVPASFDEAAQRLTLEAAAEAGFPSVRLVEEPQAAFYDWLGRGRNASLLLDALEKGTGGAARILVCDIGGGTTDFSLFEASADRSAPGGLSLRRVAVSDHLLLGGDNIDLTLAYLLEERLTGGRGRLSGRQLGQLLAQSRDLKERILREETPPDAEFPVVLAGVGSGLLSSTRTARLRSDEVREIVLDGFFPLCEAQERPRQQGGGLREWGLPYAADTAITRHMAAFVEGGRIDAVLFNGGTVIPPFLRERLHRLLGAWQGGEAPLVLANDAPSLAVARGAARYGWLLAHPEEGRRIAGGHAHALYLEVARGKGKKERSLVCILPRGMEAGEKALIDNAEFDLLVNQPVRFQCHSSHRRTGDAPGVVVPWNEREFHPLPPLQTALHLPAERPRPANDRLRVSLESSLNELGILQLWCVETGGTGRWRLDFNLRRGGEEEPVASPAAPLIPEGQRRHAEGVILAVYGKKKDPSLPDVRPRHLMRRLEETLGGARDGWDSGTLRALWPTLAAGMGRRARTPEHEAAWLMLAGWFLRPGYGVALDESRMEELWRLFAQGMAHPREKGVHVQWFLLWRRVAGGLNASRQEKVLEKILPPLRGSGDLTAEMLYLAGSLERLHLSRKHELVKLLTPGIRRPRLKIREPYAWALGRLLARAPLYAGPDAVLPPSEVEDFFLRVADLDWRSPDYAPLVPLFAQAARKIDRRDADIPESLRKEIAAKMKGAGGTTEQLRIVREAVPLEYEDRVRQFGESLPAGLILVG